MSDHPPSGQSSAHGAGGYPAGPAGFPGAPAGSTPWSPPPTGGTSRWLTFLALAIAVIATGLAIVGWFRPTPVAPPPHSTGPTYTEQQISDAKTRACAAFETVLKGVTLQTHGQPSDDPAMRKAQAVNGQLALAAGGSYLRDRLDPATPSELATAVRKTSDILLDLGANALAGAQNADQPQAGLLSEAQSSFAQVQELCK
ncbi:hypothetical protein GCM10009641_10160 [Mycobacterium cookii]|uniref:Alanine and proline rich membrane protein n=1 Tax=Mycobacterium cookii TaxID=1775 RepID=A0A7I7L0P7_9MYCO|nr:hypothetical protein MCOO_39550 [Mycobacterium cookii]